jgi:hypothetical protein
VSDVITVIPELLPLALPVPHVGTVAAAEAYLCASPAPATRRAYASDWRLFVARSEAQGLVTLPAAPQMVTLFLAVQAKPVAASKRISRKATRRVRVVNPCTKPR